MSEYFSHDYNARSNLKIKRLFRQLGLEGIGLYWCMVEILYENGGRISEDNIPDIAFDLRCTDSLVNNIVDDYNLFERENGYITSSEIIERLRLRAEKSEKARQNIMKRWNSNTTVLQSNNDSNSIKEKESKEKESKKKESKKKESKEKNNANIVDIIDYLNLKAGTKYRASTPKTVSLIKARFKEGFTVEDFKTVIDNQCVKWLTDNNMRQYLRPETLFGTKFEGYLNCSAGNSFDKSSPNSYTDLDDSEQFFKEWCNE